MMDFVKFFGGLAVVCALVYWYSDGDLKVDDGIYEDPSDSTFSYSATVDSDRAILAPDQLKCTLENQFSGTDKVSWLKHIVNPEEARQTERRNREERLRRSGCRELEMGTKLRVVESGSGYCRVRVNGEKETWWMLENDLRKDF